MFRRLVLAPLAAAWVLAGPAAAATPPAVSPERLEAFVDGAVRDGMRADHVAGVAVAVVQHGRPVLLKGYGVAARAPLRTVTPDTPFRIGSTTKVFTWVALMREVERGRLRLDDPVNRHLPPSLQFPDEGFSRPIRVRDLMSHSAGLEDRQLDGMILNDPARAVSLEAYLVGRKPRRLREPGEVASYCNYCVALAGYIVGRLEGRDYETVLEEDVFGPLGMSSTSVRDIRSAVAGLPAPMSRDLASRVSDGFTWRGASFRKEPVEIIGQIAPAGAGWSTARDMARFMAAQLAGGRLDGAEIYGAQTAQAFRTPLLRTAPGINGWNHGLMARSLGGGLTGVGHGGDTVLFHGDMLLVPELDLGVYVVANTDTGVKLVNRLPEAIVQGLYAGNVSPAPEPATVDPAALAPYAGPWLGLRRSFGGVQGFLTLLMAAESLQAGPEGLVMGSRVYVPDGPDQFRQRDGEGRLAFDRQDGALVRFRTSANADTYVRPAPWQQPEAYMFPAGLAAAAAVATLAGLFTGRRVQPRSRIQAVAGHVQTVSALAWLTSLGALGAWLGQASDLMNLFVWPGPFLTVFAAAGLVAALGSLIGAVLVVPVWRGQGWSRWRKLRYSMTAALFLGLAVVTLMRGGLDLWTL